jgi:DNA-directed RNA polymerase specialized sigma24 family protein
MPTRPGSFTTSGLPKAVVTALIRDCRAGIPGARDRLWALVYPWFHRLARVLLAHDGQRWQLTPEDLLHDAIDRVGLAYVEQPGVTRAQLRQWLLCSMREVLVDRSRRAKVRKLAANDVRACARDRRDELTACERMDLEDRLNRLQQCDKRAFHVLEMYVFGHKSLAEIAAVEGYSASQAGCMLKAAFARMRRMDSDGDAVGEVAMFGARED